MSAMALSFIPCETGACWSTGRSGNPTARRSRSPTMARSLKTLSR